MAYGYESVTINSGAAVGGDGSATANNTSSHVVTGQICSIGVTYGDSPPGTTDVTIATAGNNGPSLTILTLTNANTAIRSMTRCASLTMLKSRLPKPTAQTRLKWSWSITLDADGN